MRAMSHRWTAATETWMPLNWGHRAAWWLNYLPSIFLDEAGTISRPIMKSDTQPKGCDMIGAIARGTFYSTRS